jgi:hypothetical protein
LRHRACAGTFAGDRPAVPDPARRVPSAAPLLAAVLALQAAAGIRVVARLLPGRRRVAPVAPVVDPGDPRRALCAARG